MNFKLREYISKNECRNTIILLQMICDECPDGYESIEGDLLNIIAETVDNSDLLNSITKARRSEYLEKVESQIREVIQGLIDEVEQLEAMEPANDSQLDLELDNAERARDMRAES